MIKQKSQYAIETISLTKVFSDFWGRNKVRAVDNLNLRLGHNEVFGLLGPNGSGKTTTLKVLLGLLHPTKGKAIVLGGNSKDPKINSNIGFMPEESYLYRYLSATETLDFYGRLFDLPSKVRKLRIDALLDMVGLKSMANRPVGTFSKGMARRIGLAQALINDPDLLILDEPTTGLDPIGTRQIKDLILQLAKRGKTVLLCSHLLADVEDVCDRIAILYGGQIQDQGKVKDLLQQTNKKQIVTNNLSTAAIEKIKNIVAAENADVEITSPMEKLESFFIKTVESAQAQACTTSGAVSTTRISNFLTEQKISEDIIDKLVSSSDAQAPLEIEPVKTDQVQSADKKPDENLLQKLTATDEVVDTEPATEPVEQEIQEEPKIKTDLLDELTGKTDKHEKSSDTGESPDA